MAVIPVTTTAEVITALSTAVAGDIISCAAGTYTSMLISLYGAHGWADDIPNKVYIRSADNNNRAVFREIDLRGVVNIEFQNIDIRSASGQYIYGFQVCVSHDRCTNITYRNCDIVGQNGTGLTGLYASCNGYGIGQAISFSGSSRCSVINCRISNWFDGWGAVNSDDMLLEGTEIDNIYANSVQVNCCHRVGIVNNYMHDHRWANELDTTGVHPDNIQMGNTGSRHNINITIHGNRICEFTDVGCQGIFSTAYSMYLVTGDSSKVCSAWSDYIGQTVNVGTYVAYPPGYTVSQMTTPGASNPFVVGRCVGYICKLQHTAGDNATRPDVGASWQTYWDGPYYWESSSYINTTITDNLVYTETSHGITLYNGRGKTIIANNTLLWNPRIAEGSSRPGLVLNDNDFATDAGDYPCIQYADIYNNVGFGSFTFTPAAGCVWNVSGNQVITDGNQATYFPAVATAIRVQDLYAASTVLSSRIGSSWTLPKAYGGGMGI